MVGRAAFRIALSLFACALIGGVASAAAEDEPLWSAERFAGLELRSIGPALMSGRIADIAIHPEDDNLWYVAVGSGGVWKTGNAGVTWTPVFDDEALLLDRLRRHRPARTRKWSGSAPARTSAAGTWGSATGSTAATTAVRPGSRRGWSEASTSRRS